MGFGLPAAGAKVGNPKQDVVCISGDSSIQMSIQELELLLNIVSNFFIINNGWQEWYVNGKNPLWK
jgi:acetolactate synthase-1/2/3 large subunit